MRPSRAQAPRKLMLRLLSVRLAQLLWLTVILAAPSPSAPVYVSAAPSPTLHVSFRRMSVASAEIWDLTVSSITPWPPAVNGSLPTGVVTSPYSATLNVLYGVPPFTMNIDGPLPDNVTASLSGSTITFSTALGGLLTVGSYPINITITVSRWRSDVFVDKLVVLHQAVAS